MPFSFSASMTRWNPSVNSASVSPTVWGQQAHVMRLEHRDQLALRVARQQAVFVLAGNELREPQRPAGPARLDHLPRLQVRAADGAHLALALQIVEGTQRFLDRGQGIRL